MEPARMDASTVTGTLRSLRRLGPRPFIDMEEVCRVLPQYTLLGLLRQVPVLHEDLHLIGEKVQDVRQRILTSPHHRALSHRLYHLRHRLFPGVAGHKSLSLEHTVR